MGDLIVHRIPQHKFPSDCGSCELQSSNHRVRLSFQSIIKTALQGKFSLLAQAPFCLNVRVPLFAFDSSFERLAVLTQHI